MRTCCEPVASGAWLPREFPRPGTVYHLIKTAPENLPKFKDVIQYLEEENTIVSMV
jgi:hypothetical protein